MSVSETYLDKVVKNLELLFKSYWNDDYVVNLSIVDHCREVVQLWDKNKTSKIHMEDFRKETTDLLILLLLSNMTDLPDNSVVNIDTELLLERINKFQSKLKFQNKENNNEI